MRHSRCSRACQVDTGKGSRIATAPSSTISRANRVRVAARDTSALELLMWPRSVVGRGAKRPTAPGRSGMSIAEVRRGKAALAVARDRFTWSPKSGSSSEAAGGRTGAITLRKQFPKTLCSLRPATDTFFSSYIQAAHCSRPSSPTEITPLTEHIETTFAGHSTTYSASKNDHREDKRHRGCVFFHATSAAGASAASASALVNQREPPSLQPFQ